MFSRSKRGRDAIHPASCQIGEKTHDTALNMDDSFCMQNPDRGTEDCTVNGSVFKKRLVRMILVGYIAIRRISLRATKEILHLLGKC